MLELNDVMPQLFDVLEGEGQTSFVPQIILLTAFVHYIVRG